MAKELWEIWKRRRTPPPDDPSAAGSSEETPPALTAENPAELGNGESAGVGGLVEPATDELAEEVDDAPLAGLGTEEGELIEGALGEDLAETG